MSALLWGFLGILAVDPAAARPHPNDALPIIEIPLEPEDQRRGGSALSWHTTFDDTVLYGGTVWSPDSMRWEALRDSHWTFDTGVGSSINTGANPNKPIGYHQTMEGWFGIDQTLNPLPYFRRSSTCAISGSFSLWAGVTAGEAGLPCYATGQGYGNYWNLVVSKTFSYPGSGSVPFSFDYAVDSEPTYDFAYAEVDTSGTGAMEPIVLWTQDGLVSGIEGLTLNPGSEMRSTPGTYMIRFRASSDGGYSDEDGLYATVCGLVAIDNVIVGSDTTDFEFGMNGWAEELPVTGVGDFSHLTDLASLPAPKFFCPCGHADSVLVFFDEAGSHPLDQESIAVSPWIDLLAGGDVGRPGKVFAYDVYAEMPLANYIFVQLLVRYYPQVCSATGVLGTSMFFNDGVIFYYGEVPFCNPQSAPRLRNYSGLIPPSAEQVQMAVGILSLCRTSPFTVVCNGVTNTTPWIDNVGFGVFGAPNAPALQITSTDRFQDNFASDGTYNLSEPGRIDINRIKGASSPVPGTSLGDTLVVQGDGGNQEVRLVFRIAPGPFVSSSGLAAIAGRWTSEPALVGAYGGTWYSARMDTAEQGGVPSPGVWMSTFHEADPGRIGTDLDLDASDPGKLANDIIPDKLLTPGSRIDYFVATRYLPPDPRNPGGAYWSTIPDTSGAAFLEVEILPSSASSDGTWNSVLFVNHHLGFDPGERVLEEGALAAVLGGGGANAEGARFDRWDVQAPTSNQLSFGRPQNTEYGASFLQPFFYRRIVWHSGSLSAGQFTRQDSDVLLPWAALPSQGNRELWMSGDGLAQSMVSAGGQARTFMQSTLGVALNCTSIRLANCPAGSMVDTTYCLPTISALDPYFESYPTPKIRGNGCPDFRQYDLLSRYSGVPSAKGQLHYSKAGTTSEHFASVANCVVYEGGTVRTLLDGFAIGKVRANPGYYFSGCDEQSAVVDRTADVFDWFDSPYSCVPVSAVPPDEGLLRESLAPAFPNPTPGATLLSFVNATPNGRVRIDIFDVTGRLVRTLVNGPLPAGPHELSWDGRASDGRPVADGLYFYRMTTDGFTEARKLVVLR